MSLGKQYSGVSQPAMSGHCLQGPPPTCGGFVQFLQDSFLLFTIYYGRRSKKKSIFLLNKNVIIEVKLKIAQGDHRSGRSWEVLLFVFSRLTGREMRTGALCV